MKILLINPDYPEGCASAWLPIGLLYIASFLEKADLNVEIIDNAILNYNENRLKELIKTKRPDIVGIGGMTVQANRAIRIGELVKGINKNIKLVYGGVHFTFVPEDGLKYGDVVVIGEGEKTFLEICQSNDLNDIKGICFFKDGKVFKTEKREQEENLDIFHFPAFHLIDINSYNDFLISGERAISILTGRGCPYNCEFCASPQLYFRKVRYHSIDYIIKLIEHLIENYKLKNLRIMDDTFILNKKRILDFCENVKKFKLNMTCLTHINNGDYETFMKMKEAGFSIIALGIESGNENILRLIGKNITKDDVRKDVEIIKRVGLDIELLFMIGNIGETKETIIESIKFAKELKAKYTWFQFAVPFPGSRFFDIAKKYGKVLTYNYDFYTHQRPVFIPLGLDEKTLIYLHKKALITTSKNRFFKYAEEKIKSRIPKRLKDYIKKIIR